MTNKELTEYRQNFINELRKVPVLRFESWGLIYFRFDIVNEDYSLVSSGPHNIMWYTKNYSKERSPEGRKTFDHVFNKVSEQTKKELIYHLDLFK